MGRKEEGREGGRGRGEGGREGGRGKKEGKRGDRKGSTGGEGEREHTSWDTGLSTTTYSTCSSPEREEELTVMFL